MTIQVKVSLSRTRGAAELGPPTARISISTELPDELLGEPPRFQDHIRKLFGLARQALAEETGAKSRPAKTRAEAGPLPVPSALSPSAGCTGSLRPATLSQIKTLLLFARAKRIDLRPYLEEHFQVRRPDELTAVEASRVITVFQAAQERSR